MMAESPKAVESDGAASESLDARARPISDVDRAVVHGRARRVLFGSLADLMTAIWDSEINYEEWLRRGVSVEFATGPGLGPEVLEVLHQSWHSWRKRYRRRRTIAGLLLSMIVVLAAFVLILTLQHQL